MSKSLVLKLKMTYLALCLGMPVSVLGWQFLKPSFEIWSAQTWTETRCEILASRVNEIVTSGRYRSVEYEVQAQYVFVVNAKAYQGDRVDFFKGRYDSRESADRLSRQLVSRSPVPCYYNPDNLLESVIDNQIRYWRLLLPVAILFLMFGILYYARDSFKMAEKNEKS